MAASGLISTKRGLIDKANTTVVAVVSAATFLVIFSLVATKTLISQARYQGRVISEKRSALNILKQDISDADKLKVSYAAFTSTAQNVIGGNPTGTGQQDGDNAKIVLDALPSTYDFPGLTTSLEYLLSNRGVKINSISGVDDEVAQSTNTSSTTPQAVPIPFDVSVAGDYTGIRNVINAFERSIRPMAITKVDISGSQQQLTMSVSAQTYYQPAKSLNIKKQVLK